MKLSKGIRRGERVVFFFWLGDDHHIHAFIFVLSTMNVPRIIHSNMA